MTEADIDPNESSVINIEAQSEPCAGLQIGELEQRAARHYFSGVEKECAIQSGEDLPLILGVVHHFVAIAETEWTEAAEIVRAPKNRLKIERGRLIGVRL